MSESPAKKAKTTSAPSPVEGMIVGSYATSPNLYALEHPTEAAYNAEREAAFYAGLAEDPLCGGIEVQLDGAGVMHCFDEEAFLAKFIQPRWCAVLTCIGGTMGNIGKNAKFGLASTDPPGRQSAIEFARQALAAVKRWNSRGDGKGRRVVAVQVHSGPNQTKPGAESSVEAFAASLEVLMGWDWEGAKLVVEHCDAPASHPASKGFLTLGDEIKAIEAANSSGDTKNGTVGITINWARSVLETRDPATAVTHIGEAGAAGLLSGLMFSGCTPEPKASNSYGEWKDCHMPHAPTPGAAFAADGSLMTAARIEEALKTASSTGSNPLLYRGCKITSLHTGMWVGSTDDDTDARIGINRALLAIIDAAESK